MHIFKMFFFNYLTDRLYRIILRIIINNNHFHFIVLKLRFILLPQ